MSKTTPGFIYRIVTRDRHGCVIDEDVVKNLMPTEGLHHLINGLLRGGTAVGTWYLGLFGNAYTPVDGDTMATFPGSAGEITSYSAATRPAITFDAPAAGVSTNAANKITATFTGAATVMGGFIGSQPSKGATAGVLLSAVRFPTAKQIPSDGGSLELTVGLEFISL